MRCRESGPGCTSRNSGVCHCGGSVTQSRVCWIAAAGAILAILLLLRF